MLADVIDLLRCPVCRDPLEAAGTGRLCCVRGHAFDVARQGYLNLVGGAPGVTGDTAAMIAARDRFLQAGHYAPITAAVAAAVRDSRPSGSVPERARMIEVGAGTGHHLAGVVGRGVGLAVDVSRYAARRAAKSHPRVGAVVADLRRCLPVRTGVADAVLDIFAPRNVDEMHRVLRPGGQLITVIPTVRHLAEIATTLGLLRVDHRKDERLEATVGRSFTEAGRVEVEFTMMLSHQVLADLIEMGPNAFHNRPAEVHAQIVDSLPDPTSVVASVTVISWARR